MVTTRPDELKWGYNLDRDLNRDRELLDEWDLKYALSQLTVEAFKAAPDTFGSHLEEILDNTNSLEGGNAYAFSSDQEVVSHVGDRFLKSHGDAIPVENRAKQRS